MLTRSTDALVVLAVLGLALPVNAQRPEPFAQASPQRVLPGYASAEAWCSKKHDQTAGIFIPQGRRATREEAERTYEELQRGRNAFMRECMKNQGYVYEGGSDR